MHTSSAKIRPISAAAARVIDDLNEGADALSVESLVDLPELRRPDGTKPSVRTVWRYIKSGKLDTAKVMGRRVTTGLAVLRMLANAN